jgi:hypothetical protein
MNDNWTYGTSFQPPFPQIQVKLFTPWTELSPVLTEMLQIDTGADMTGIPLDWIHQLEPRLLDWVGVVDFDNNLVDDIPIFEVGLEIGGRRFNSVRVYGLNSAIGFIGRDVINNYLIRLDGPKRLTLLE